MSDFNRDFRRDYLLEYRIGLGLGRRNSHMLVTSHIETASAQEIMDELREADPESHAKLSEMVVIGDDGRVTDESLEIIVAWINGLDR